MHSLILSKPLKIPEVGKWGRTEVLQPPCLGHSESALLEPHISGVSNLKRKTQGRLENPWGGEAGSSSGGSASPSSSPLYPPGAAGNYLLKRRPRSHLFAVNNPRHRSAFIKPFPSPHYFNNKSRVTFRRRY